MSIGPVGHPIIEPASDHPREISTAEHLRRLLLALDMQGLQWADRVVIEHRAVPHSHPTLTLNTRSRGDALVATYIHEQLHWWTAAHPEFGAAMTDTGRAWPVVPQSGDGGAHDEQSTRLHLIVCHLERRAVQDVLGPLRADAVLDRQVSDGRVYPWVYRQVRGRADELDRICTARHLWPARLDPGNS